MTGEMDRIRSESLRARDDPDVDHRANARLLQAEVERLRAQVAAIKFLWQHGIGGLDTPWRKRMGELIGDTEGLDEAAIARAATTEEETQ